MDVPTTTSFVADNVRAEMARAKLTQTDLANILGITQQAISAKLNAHTAFSVAELVTISDALKVPIAALMAVAA
jgi:transcriptional regulator with XRE-family HTH domain